MRLHGKLAVISGASRGIGASIARTLAQRGASTVLLGRQLETLERTRQSLVCNLDDNQTHKAFPLDVARPEEWDALIKEISTPDILVNVAGTTIIKI